MRKRQIKKDRALIARSIAAGQTPPDKVISRLMRDRRFLSLDAGKCTNSFDDMDKEIFKNFRI